MLQDPPSGWELALKIIGSAVLAGALGGVGGVLAGALIKEGAKQLTVFVMNAAIEAGKKATEESVNTAIGSSAGAGDKAPLVAFCEQQRLGLAKASWRASEDFSNRSGDAGAPKIGLEEMKEIQKANNAARDRAGKIQSKEMLIGWMNLIAGDKGLQKADKEGTRADGILTLVVSGHNDNVAGIRSATAGGLNKSLKASISGSKVADWVTGPNRTRGLNIIVRTGSIDSKADSFEVSAGTKARMKEAGVWASTLDNAIYFAYGIDSKTGTSWTDQDMWMAYDQNWGANAGRWFLDNVKNQHTLLAELGSKTIPSVT